MCIYKYSYILIHIEEQEVVPKKGAAQKRKSPVAAKSAVKKGINVCLSIYIFSNIHIYIYICM